MNKANISFSAIIPTIGRPEELTICIDSIARQTRPPEEVIIVDDGDLSSQNLQKIRNILPETTELQITESNGPPGSSTARNTGINLATQNIVVFFDDDVILGETYFERLENLYDKHDSETLAGIGGFRS